jgi:hypothetical protein
MLTRGYRVGRAGRREPRGTEPTTRAPIARTLHWKMSL